MASSCATTQACSAPPSHEFPRRLWGKSLGGRSGAPWMVGVCAERTSRCGPDGLRGWPQAQTTLPTSDLR
jgi:hypothetical protein